MRLGQAGRRRRLPQPAEVAAGRRAERGVDGGGRRALELAHLRRDLVRGDDEGVRQRVAQDLRHALLVRGIQEREQQADGHRLHTLAGEPARGALHALLIELAHHAGRPHPLVDLDAQPALDHRRRRRLVQAIEAGPRLAAEEQQVAESLGGDERGAREPALEQRVGGDRRAVDEVRDLARLDAGSLEHLARGRHHALLLARGAEHLGGDQPSGPTEHRVGERAADVDAERAHSSTAAAASSPSRTA